MKFFYFLFSIAMAITTAQAAAIIQHTIKDRETIPMLAKKYCTTKAIIEKMNNLQPNKYVKRGTVLNIALNTAPIKKEKRVVRNIATVTKISTNTKGLHGLDEIRKKRQLKTVKKEKTNNNEIIKKEVASRYVIKQTNSSSVHTLDEIRKKRQLDKKTYAGKSKPKVTKHMVRQAVVKKKKIHALKSVRKEKKLVTTLKKYKKPFKSKKASSKRVTVNDITFKSSRSSTSSNNKDINKIINLAKQKLGRRYVWGAVGKSGTFDCSGFTSYVYKKIGIHIPRTSRNQAKYGKYVSRNNLKKGDLIFFDTSKHRKGYVNHVGIYLGNGKFIHASSAKKRVVVSSLSKFYAQRYVGARRPS